MMDTREVAAYLRLKERRVYDLVRRDAIPHVRATGKLLFPRRQIDAWLAAKSGTSPATERPPIIAGSHDPLLEWAARTSASGLAILACGSRAGVDRLARGKATVAAIHWRDEATGVDNVPLVRSALAGADVVMLEWARRTQGLLLARDNPLRIRTLDDLRKKHARVVPRQRDAGSHRLFEHLLAEAKIAVDEIAWLPYAAHAETDLADAIADGRADAGLGIEAAARTHGLAFIPLALERMDLVVRRHDAFEPPLQTLLAFTRSVEFSAQARSLCGYDVANVGRVVFNA
ncbi:MAG TPA: helix-turn-helix transcriptional regulator [Casimicrobiaceae bacterium]|jgi:excisionase family DNA binding protein